MRESVKQRYCYREEQYQGRRAKQVNDSRAHFVNVGRWVLEHLRTGFETYLFHDRRILGVGLETSL